MLSFKCWQKLEREAHPDLKKVFSRAEILSDMECRVLEVLRTLETQKRYVARGSSQTMNSRHLAHPSDGKSRAIDIVPWDNGQPIWDWAIYHKLAPIIKQAALEVKVPIIWGGDWRSLKDGPHWELDRKFYP